MANTTLVCPACRESKLAVGRRIALPADADWDEIDLQVVICSSCRFEAIALYLESRHGSIDSESWRHDGYRVSPADIKLLSSIIDACPDRLNRRCPCSSHQRLATFMTQGAAFRLPAQVPFPIECSKKPQTE